MQKGETVERIKQVIQECLWTPFGWVGAQWPLASKYSTGHHCPIQAIIRHLCLVQCLGPCPTRLITHIALSEPMTSKVQKGSSLGSCPIIPSSNPYLKPTLCQALSGKSLERKKPRVLGNSGKWLHQTSRDERNNEKRIPQKKRESFLKPSFTGEISSKG